MQSYLLYRRLGLKVRKQLDSEGNNLHKPVPVLESTESGTSKASPGSGEIPTHQAAVALDTDHQVSANSVHEGDSEKAHIVGWEGADDPENPRNWSTAKRVLCGVQISLIAGAVTSASGIDATIIPQAAKEFGVSDVAQSLGTGMFLIGQGIGTLIAGPFSELFGRNYVYAGSMAIFMIWIMASALAPNFGAYIVFRFLAGLAGSTPLVCSGGSISDMYDPLEKTWGFALFAGLAFGGPILGAVIGAYIGPSPLISWRWTDWMTLIYSGLITMIVLLFMPETYSPVILQWRAKKLREFTGNSRYLAEHELSGPSVRSRLRTTVTRPFVLMTEPIIMAMSVYISLVYIVLFTFFIGWPYIFEYTYNIGQGLANIIWVAMFVGVQFMFLLVPVVYRKISRQMKGSEGTLPGTFKPEVRLWFAMLGSAVAIPVSLFWLGWTANPSISIWSPICACVLFGYGITGIFVCTYTYIIDSYEVYSASALTFVALTRYVCSGGMTVVGIPFFKNMGVHYTLTILACLSCVTVPIPYALYKWGYVLRKKSKYAVAREF